MWAEMDFRRFQLYYTLFPSSIKRHEGLIALFTLCTIFGTLHYNLVHGGLLLYFHFSPHSFWHGISNCKYIISNLNDLLSVNLWIFAKDCLYLEACTILRFPFQIQQIQKMRSLCSRTIIASQFRSKGYVSCNQNVRNYVTEKIGTN